MIVRLNDHSEDSGVVQIASIKDGIEGPDIGYFIEYEDQRLEVFVTSSQFNESQCIDLLNKRVREGHRVEVYHTILGKRYS